MTTQVQQLNSVSGPVVRINPDEIHIDDPSCDDVSYVEESHKMEESVG